MLPDIFSIQLLSLIVASFSAPVSYTHLKLEQAKPDLILTDVKMPGMDGLGFAEKAHEIYPNAVIVIQTGYDSFAYAQKAISIGVVEYLLEPVDYDELKAMAARIAGEIHARKMCIRDSGNIME